MSFRFLGKNVIANRMSYSATNAFHDIVTPLVLVVRGACCHASGISSWASPYNRG
jgi:hypothetical protein